MARTLKLDIKVASSPAHPLAVEILAKLAQTHLRQTRFPNPLTREDKTTREAAPRARLIIRCAEIRLITAISFPYRYATAASAAGRRRIFLLAFRAFDDHFDLLQTFCIKTNTRLKLCVSVSLSRSVRRNNNEARVHSRLMPEQLVVFGGYATGSACVRCGRLYAVARLGKRVGLLLTRGSIE